MKKLIHLIFPSLKPKYFIVNGIHSNPYGERVYPFIFDIEHEVELAKKSVEGWMNSTMKRGFWDCHDAKFSHETNKYSFKSAEAQSEFMMGSYKCSKNVNHLKYFSDHFTGDTEI